MSDQVRINGVQHSWGSIVLKIGGDKFYGFTAIHYSDELVRVAAYGAGRRAGPQRRSTGKYRCEPARLSGPISTMQALRTALASRSQGGRYGDVEFDITVQYVESGDYPQTVVLERSLWQSNLAMHSEGSDPLEEDVLLDVLRIQRNGLVLFDLDELVGNPEPGAPEADYILLGGYPSPGICEITGAQLNRRLHVYQSQYQWGATVVYGGAELVEFTVRLKLYNPRDWLLWDEWSAAVMKPPAERQGLKATGALDIVHPTLALIGINAVLVKSIRAPEQTDDGEWTIELGMLEYRPAVAVKVRPAGPQATPADPDPVEQEILSDANQLSALAAQ